MNLGAFNILTCVRAGWLGIDRRYKTALAIGFPIALLTFSIFTFHYMFDNHAARLPDIRPTDQYFAGRWFSRFAFWLTGYSNIPVLQQVLSMAFQFGAGVVALRLWGLRSLTRFSTTIVLLIIAVHPNNLTSFYHTYMSLLYPFSAFLSACGMLVASRAANGGLRHFILGSTVGGILVCLSIATYQAGMSVGATLAAGYAIMRFVEYRERIGGLLLRHFRPVWAMATAGMLGGIFYVISLKVLGIGGAYATAGGNMLSLVDLPRRFIEITRKSFLALWITQPEFSRSLKVALLMTLFLAAGFLAGAVVRCHPYRRRLILAKWSILVILLVGLIMTTKALFYTISMQSLFIYRYNLSMPFFSAFCFYAIFATASTTRFGVWRSMAVMLACCVVFSFARSNLLRQGILLAGHRHDFAIANRILDRVESLPDLDFSKKYYVVRTRPYSPERIRMLNTLRPYDTAGGGHMDVAEIGAYSWAAEVPFKALGSRIAFKTILDDLQGNNERAKNLVKERNAKRWPDPSSIFVDGDMIVINM